MCFVVISLYLSRLRLALFFLSVLTGSKLRSWTACLKHMESTQGAERDAGSVLSLHSLASGNTLIARRVCSGEKRPRTDNDENQDDKKEAKETAGAPGPRRKQRRLSRARSVLRVSLPRVNTV